MSSQAKRGSGSRARPTGQAERRAERRAAPASRAEPRPEPMLKRRVPDDPELFRKDLDFYFGEIDAISGLRGIPPSSDENRSGASQSKNHQGSDAEIWMHVSTEKMSNKPTDTITDEDLIAIRYGRRVWAAVTQVPWAQQEILKRYYGSAHALAAMAGAGGEYVGGGGRLVESEIRAAHIAYAAVASGISEQPPRVIDRTVDGDVPDKAPYRARGEDPLTKAESKQLRRAMEDFEHDGAGLARRFYSEEKAAGKVAKAVEPLLRGPREGANKFPKLHRGINVFPPKEFEAMIEFLIEEPRLQRAAIKRGKYRLPTGSAVIVAAPDMAGELITLREYERRTGIPRATLGRDVVHLGLSSVKRANKKLFNIEQLERGLLVLGRISPRKYEVMHRSGD